MDNSAADQLAALANHLESHPTNKTMPPPPAIGGPGFVVAGDLAAMFGALSAAQANYAPLKKTRENPFFHSVYADLSDVLEACMPALQEQGFALLQPPVRAAGNEWVLYTILGHKSGGYFQCEASIPPVTDWQKFGSAVTYCRRYQVSALLGVAAEPDDDGNGTTQKPQEGLRQNSRPTPPPAPAKAADRPKEAPKAAPKETPKESGGAASPGVVSGEGPGSKTESAPAPAPKEAAAPAPSQPAEATRTAPPAAAEAKKSTPPPSSSPITNEQQKEIGAAFRGARLLPTADPTTGEVVNMRFRRPTADEFCMRVVGKATVQVSSAADGDLLIAALRELPPTMPAQIEAWGKLGEKFKDAAGQDTFVAGLIGKPAGQAWSVEEIGKVVSALQALS